MGEDNSPSFARGVADGQLDAAIISTCPPGAPIGPNPPNPAYPAMYTHGYDSIMRYAMPHSCGPGCPNWDREHGKEDHA